MHGHAQRRSTPGKYVGCGKCSLEVTKLNPSFWRNRPVFITGATGLVGSWLVRRLLDSGADIVCLVRDWVPQSEAVRSGLLEQVKVVRGDVRDQACIERALGEYEIDTVFHLAAQTIVPIANRNPISTFETNIQGTWILLEA
jgi:CDP-glucose 4,6-dehydratase